MRRKAECGRRRPLQRCGPRPSPQVTGWPFPSRPDPPLSFPPGGPGTAQPRFSAPCAPRALPSEASLCVFFGSGGASPGAAASIGSVQTRSSPWELPLPGDGLFWQPGGGGGPGAELENSAEEFGPAERLVELLPPCGDYAAQLYRAIQVRKR